MHHKSKSAARSLHVQNTYNHRVFLLIHTMSQMMKQMMKRGRGQDTFRSSSEGDKSTLRSASRNLADDFNEADNLQDTISRQRNEIAELNRLIEDLTLEAQRNASVQTPAKNREIQMLQQRIRELENQLFQRRQDNRKSKKPRMVNRATRRLLFQNTTRVLGPLPSLRKSTD